MDNNDAKYQRPVRLGQRGKRDDKTRFYCWRSLDWFGALFTFSRLVASLFDWKILTTASNHTLPQNWILCPENRQIVRKYLIFCRSVMYHRSKHTSRHFPFCLISVKNVILATCPGCVSARMKQRQF